MATQMLLNLMFDRLIKRGELTVIDSDGRARTYGRPSGRRVTIRLADRGIERALVSDAILAVGEGYMDGRITIEQGDLFELLALGTENLAAMNPAAGPMPWSVPLGRMVRRFRQFNTPGRSAKNVAHHYDLSGELYALFLDSERQYTCAYHPSGTETLEEAQRKKERHIAAKLLLEPGQKVADLGCGWGALAFHLAREHGVDVTGVTLSKEQAAWANARAAALGVADRVRFLHQDYRATTGRFDRVVSIGLLEHVGISHYDVLFRKIKELLPPNGVGLVHSIGRASGPSYTNAWIRKYIFPGGYIPALSEVIPAVERSGLWTTDIEILRLHYAHTLRQWRERFMANREQAKALYDERFCRMWEFYLVASEVFFLFQDGMNFQIQVSPDRAAVPLARDYMVDGERQATAAQGAALAQAAE